MCPSFLNLNVQLIPTSPEPVLNLDTSAVSCASDMCEEQEMDANRFLDRCR